MTEILKQANEIGKAIIADERYVKYEQLKNKQMEDEALQVLISEFNLKRTVYMNEAQNKEADPEKVKALMEDVDKVYSKVMENETMKELEAAANEFETLINAVFSTINFHITGQEQTGCDTSKCGSCGGGCSSN